MLLYYFIHVFIIFLIFLCVYLNDKKKGNIKFWEIIIIIFPCAFFATITFTLHSIIAKANMKTYELIYKEYEIVALKDNNDINGNSYFLGSSYIEERLYYHFYYNDKGRGIKYKKIDAEGNYPSVYIIETNEKNPKYIRYGSFYKNKKNAFYTSSMISETRDVLYVPKGSIKRKFQLDLE